MPCQHEWEMRDVRFGFVVFERCFHCNRLRTSFSPEQWPYLGDEYREGDCYWSRVENAQSFRFALRCGRCGESRPFDDLMGLLHCTGCDPTCQVDILQRELEAQGQWVLVSFGFIAKDRPTPLPPGKLETLSAYFNQRRDPSRPSLRLLSADLIGDVSRCRGEFLHDVGMLSKEPPPAVRTSPFESSTGGMP